MLNSTFLNSWTPWDHKKIILMFWKEPGLERKRTSFSKDKWLQTHLIPIKTVSCIRDSLLTQIQKIINNISSEIHQTLVFLRKKLIWNQKVNQNYLNQAVKILASKWLKLYMEIKQHHSIENSWEVIKYSVQNNTFLLKIKN